MNPFLTIERWCADRVERSFARVFPSRLEPVHIARRLTSTLEAISPPPTAYNVVLHPADVDVLEPELADLQASWIRMLTEMAGHLGLPLAEIPRIAIVADGRLVPGSVRIDAEPGMNVLRLRVTRGIPANLVVTVDRPLIIGRAPESDIALFDPSVSRRHARVARVGETLEIEDLGSANGVFLAARRVEKGLVRRGETLELGNCELRVE